MFPAIALSIVFLNCFRRFILDICPRALVVEYPLNLWILRAAYVILHKPSEIPRPRYCPVHDLMLLSDFRISIYWLDDIFTSYLDDAGGARYFSIARFQAHPGSISGALCSMKGGIISISCVFHAALLFAPRRWEWQES